MAGDEFRCLVAGGKRPGEKAKSPQGVKTPLQRTVMVVNDMPMKRVPMKTNSQHGHAIKLACVLFTLLFAVSSRGQGFLNLDFEAATIPSNPTYADMTAANLFPNWTVSPPLVYTVYNSFSLSGGSISLISSNSGFILPIQGKYSVLLWGTNPNGPDGPIPISLGQTGQIPVWARSISYWGDDQGLQITFNGAVLAFSTLSTTANYNVYGADISAYAGQTGQLLISALSGTGGSQLDNIQFSSTAVPEPGTVALIVTGGWLLGCRRKLFITR